MKKLTLIFTLFFALMWGSYITMAESTIIVNTTSDELNLDGDCSLREAIQAVNTGSDVDNCSVSGGSPYTIELSAGTYTLSLAGAGDDNNQTGDLDIKGDVTINGVDAESTIIDGNQLDRVLQVHNGQTVEINRVKMTNGKTQASNISGNSGAGVYNSGTLTLNHSIVSDNMTGSNGSYGGFGGAIYNDSDSTLTINHSTMSNNTTGDGSQHGGHGGAIYNQEGGVATINNSTMSDNTTGDGNALGGAGGAIYNRSELTINHSTMNKNTTGNGNAELGYGGFGGAVYNHSQLTINHSTINDNTTGNGNTHGGYGGGVYNYLSGVLTINNSTISNNTTGTGKCLAG